MARVLAPLAGFGAALALFAAACSGAPSDARIGIDAPDETQFPPVADYLEHRCGTLDCHGNSQRNLVMWGSAGLRLDPANVPGGKRTSMAEYDATYRSLVGLEPTLMSAVVQGHGAHPEVLTFVRKARGDERHKGGALITAGDAQDLCIASWLAGATDKDQCTAALCIAEPSTCPTTM